MRPSRQTKQVWDPAKIVIHDHDIRRFDGDVRAGDSHRDPDVRFGECRCIVDAVADHGRRTLASQLPNGGQFVFRQQVAPCLAETRLGGNSLGSALIAAAAEGVDSTPMEGFEPEKVDAILDLASLGLRSVLLLPLGYRAAEGDWLVNLSKVRRSSEDFIIHR